MVIASQNEESPITAFYSELFSLLSMQMLGLGIDIFIKTSARSVVHSPNNTLLPLIPPMEEGSLPLTVLSVGTIDSTSSTSLLIFCWP